jgi:hypothetical protein
MRHVTLQVPERYAERFRAEAVQVLGSIAGSIKNTTDKIEAARDHALEPAAREVDAQALRCSTRRSWCSCKPASSTAS